MVTITPVPRYDSDGEQGHDPEQGRSLGNGHKASVVVASASQVAGRNVDADGNQSGCEHELT